MILIVSTEHEDRVVVLYVREGDRLNIAGIRFCRLPTHELPLLPNGPQDRLGGCLSDRQEPDSCGTKLRSRNDQDALLLRPQRVVLPVTGTSRCPSGVPPDK